MSWRDWFRPYKPERDAVRVEMTPDGFSLLRGKERFVIGSLRWDDVVEVWGYKKDCYAIDQFRLVFINTGGMTHEVTEDDGGYGELREVASRVLAFDPDWYERALFATPPFDGTIQKIWKRDKPLSV